MMWPQRLLVYGSPDQAYGVFRAVLLLWPDGSVQWETLDDSDGVMCWPEPSA